MLKIFQGDKFQYKLLIFPALLGTMIFIAIPVLFSFGLSFCEWDLLSPIRFSGLKNYLELLNSPQFGLILKNTFLERYRLPQELIIGISQLL